MATPSEDGSVEYLSDEEAEQAYRRLYPNERPPGQPRTDLARRAAAKKAAAKKPSRTTSPAAPSRSASRAGRKLARTRPATSKKPGYLDRAFSPSAAANRLGAGKITSGGDAGGLLLALVLYPIALSIIQHGADGPKMWFQAKWLNQAWGQLEQGPVGQTPRGDQRGDPQGKNFQDFGGFYGPPGAVYPAGVTNSPFYVYQGRNVKNPNYHKRAS